MFTKLSKNLLLFSLLSVFSLAELGCAKKQSGIKYIPNQYIVILKKSSQVSNEISSQSGDTPSQLEVDHNLEPAKLVFNKSIHGGVYNMSEEQAQEIKDDPNVAYVEQDQFVQSDAVETGATWGLDRLDQVSLPLNQNYSYDNSGAIVNAYIIDTGILTSHIDFHGRAYSAIDIVDGDIDATDCNGHGTHVAGTIGSSAYGVAKNVKLFGVRVLDCFGGGSLSNVIAGIDWVTAHHQSPAVANMSLGGLASQAIDDAVAASIQSGVTFVVAAGNENVSACGGSPARLSEAITVGSSTNLDARSSFSNFGSCVDVFAPGSDITSLWIGSTSATNTISGTSMASPHVAGVAALYLAKHPSASPAEVASAIVSGSLQGRLSGIGAGSPNLLVNTLFISGSAQGPSPAPAPSPVPAPSPAPSPTPSPSPSPVPSPVPCTHCEYSGVLSGTKSSAYLPSAAGFQSLTGAIKVSLSGPANADFDLYVYKLSGTVWRKVASSVSSSSTELINYKGTPGKYRIKVLSYFGGGKYISQIK